MSISCLILPFNSLVGKDNANQGLPIIGLSPSIMPIRRIVGAEIPVPTAGDVLTDWYRCGMRLLELSGRTEDYLAKLPTYYRSNSTNPNPEFIRYMYAVIYVESRFNRNAHSSQEAYGLMQLTPVAIQDASAECGLRRIKNMDRLYDSGLNIQYGSCYLNKLYREMGGDWTRILIAYNGGYATLTRYDRGENINPETANYALQVVRAVSICND